MREAEARAFDLEAEARLVRIEFAPTPRAVATRADIFSVHLAFGPETKGLVGREVLAGLKPGATLINTARAEIVDHAALLEVAREKARPRRARCVQRRARYRDW